MKILIFLFMILIISSLIIFESNNLQITDKNDMKTFSEKYTKWADEIYTNLQNITGQAIKLNWLPG